MKRLRHKLGAAIKLQRTLSSILRVPHWQPLSDRGFSNPPQKTESPRSASGTPRDGAQSPGVGRRGRGLRAAVQAPVEWGGGGGSPLARPAASGKERRAEIAPGPDPPAPRWPRGGPKYAKLGRGVLWDTYLGARPGSPRPSCSSSCGAVAENADRRARSPALLLPAAQSPDAL